MILLLLSDPNAVPGGAEGGLDRLLLENLLFSNAPAHPPPRSIKVWATDEARLTIRDMPD